MANNTVLNPGALGDVIATEDIAGVKYELVKVLFGGNGIATKVDAANPFPVSDAVAEAALNSIAGEDFATEATLAALLAKVISAPSTEAKQDAMIALLTTIAAISQPLTDAQLRNTPVPVSGTVTVTGAGDASAANQTSQITQETAINTVLGLISDAIVAAGATGSISAKLRRATQGLEDLKTSIVLAAGANAIGKLAANSGVVIGAVEIAAAQTLAAVTAITNNVNTVEVPPTTIFNGKTSTVTAGTRVVLAASQVVKSVTIKALSTNTGFIYVGNATVSAANGFQLSAGDTVSMDISNLNTVNIDSSVNAEGVTYFAVGI